MDELDVRVVGRSYDAFGEASGQALFNKTFETVGGREVAYVPVSCQ